MSGPNIADRKVWLTIAGDVVEDGDPEARFLLAAEGDEIPDGYKVPKGKAKEAPVDPIAQANETAEAAAAAHAETQRLAAERSAAEAAEKAVDAPANKAVKAPAADKAKAGPAPKD